MTGKRIVFPMVKRCEIESFDVPSVPSPGIVLIRVCRTLISPGTEFNVFTGRHTNLSNRDSGWLRFPFYPGYSAVGEVLAVGEGVTSVRPGDIVFAETSHASHALVVEAKVIKIEATMGMERPTFTELGAIALNGVRTGAITLGERVGVFGQGIVGLLALRLARLAGATRLTAFDLSSKRLEISRRWGADVTVTSDGKKSPVDVIRDTNDKHLADVIIEATGSPAVIAGCLPCVRTGGRVVLLGSPHGNVTLNFYQDIHARNLRLLGAHVSPSEHVATPIDPWSRQRNRLTFLDLVARGAIAVEELVTHRVTPNDLPDLYRHMTEHPTETLGMIVNWEKES